MEGKRFKVGFGALALVVFALSDCASKSDPGLVDAVGSGGVPGASGSPGGGGEPGAGGAECIAVAPGAGGAPTEADFDAEEQVVYAAALVSAAAWSLDPPSPPSLYLFQTETGVGDLSDSVPPLPTLDAHLAGMLSNHPALSAETTASFAARNATAYPVATDMNIGVPYALITDEEIAQIRDLSQGQLGLWVWLPEFSARYPGAKGYTELSRVGFNSSFDQALVYIGSMYGPLAGEGYFYVLQRCTVGWVVTYQEMDWLS